MSLLERFWQKVVRGPDCWLWTASKNQQGYGQIFISKNPKRGRLAHRLSWEIANGEIPEGLCVLHRCDVPACVNPEHLFLGTKADNNHDMLAKGRFARGEMYPQTRLTATDVRAILNDVRPQVIIAKQYGIDPSSVSHIKRGKSWAHVK